MAERAARPAAPVSIRPGRIEDADAIHGALLGIGDAVGERHKITSTVDDIRHFGFGPHPAFETLIAEIDSEFAGMCLYFPIFSSWMGRPGVYVQDLFVAERFRGFRIGERLLRRLTKLSKDSGGVYLRLSVDTDNAKAKAFYERLGISHARGEQVHKILGEAFFQFADGDSPA
ncbi:acetyltransferase [Mesorhizobium sp. Root157]|uniref:GNAT family N-acetyltransferase n=1 Tax=Mesorhizobium sp. Root157 TaxID=1736477 RepID=UPI0006F1FD35|nr:GNAT family N-acetyltransferase [Mesorhizobium sp. Root157]KQZ78256.1 acetyltransferase [Mesorhizobium sp. Root157]